jgi:phage FluMu protein gp41
MTNINHFIEREGQIKGPFSFEQLQQFSQNGILRHDDLVWPEGSTQ